MAQRFYFFSGGGAFFRGTEDIPVFMTERDRRLIFTADDIANLFDTFERNDTFIDTNSVTIASGNYRAQTATPTRTATITAATEPLIDQISDAAVISTITRTSAVWDDGSKLLYWATDIRTQTAKNDAGERRLLITYDVEMSMEFLLGCSIENYLPVCGTGRVGLINPPIGQYRTAGEWLANYNITPKKLPPVSGGMNREAVRPCLTLTGNLVPGERDYTYIIVGSYASASAANAPSTPFCLEYGKIDGDSTYGASEWYLLALFQHINIVTVRYQDPTTTEKKEIKREYNYTIDKIVIVPRWLYPGTAPENPDMRYYIGDAYLARPLGGGSEATTGPWVYGNRIYNRTAHLSPALRTYGYTSGNYAFAVGTVNTRIMFAPTRSGNNTDADDDGQLYCAPHVEINAAETGVSITIGADNSTATDIDITDDLAVRGTATASASQQRESDTARQLSRISAVVGVAGQAAGSAAAIGSGNVYAGVTGFVSAGLTAYDAVRRAKVGQYTVPQRNAATLDGKYNAIRALGGVCVWEYQMRDDVSGSAPLAVNPQCGLYGWDGDDAYISIEPKTLLADLCYVDHTASKVNVSYLQIAGLSVCGADTGYSADVGRWLVARLAAGMRLWVCEESLTASNYGDYTRLITRGAH